MGTVQISVETVSTNLFADQISEIWHQWFKKNLTNSRSPAHGRMIKVVNGILWKVDSVCHMHMT